MRKKRTALHKKHLSEARQRVLDGPHGDELRGKLSKGVKHWHETKDADIESERRRKLSAKAKKRYRENPESHPNLGKHHSEETKKKMSQRRKQWHKTHENPMRGRKLNVAQCQQISLRQKRYYETHDPHMKGKHHSQETKDKVSRAKRQQAKEHPEYWAHAKKPRSVEYRAKVACSLKTYYAERPELAHSRMANARSQGRYGNTKIEQTVAQMLKSFQVKFQRQARVSEFTNGFKHVYFDFVLPSLKLIIECDGCWWHGCGKCHPERTGLRQKDYDRNRKIRAHGWGILRLWEHDIKKRPEKVQADITSALKKMGYR